MLVATALVVLIMLMFAQIYGSAVGSIREQRGLANNDQKARIIETTLRSDLQSMTFRQPTSPYGNVQGIVPLSFGDTPLIDPVQQRGYLYISENSASHQDDILQFTIFRATNQRGDAITRLRNNRLVGKAANLGGTNSTDNEPDTDDGIQGNGQGTSRVAEVAYFMRNGNLYRRVLLLRDPPSDAMPADSQPTRGTARNRMYGPNGIFSSGDYGGTSFYRDFDYAVTRFNDRLWFHSIDSLANNLGEANVPIAMPKYRFGFTETGVSVEDDGTNHIGRFTLQEMSDSRYNYPETRSTPYDSSDITLDTSTFVVDEFNEIGNRMAEDILLTNVQDFDVQLFNPNPDADDNDASTTSDEFYYSLPAVAVGSNLPITAFDGSTFDTWHPSVPTSVTNSSRKLIKEESRFRYNGPYNNPNDLSTRREANNSTAENDLPRYVLIPALNPVLFRVQDQFENGGGMTQPADTDIESASLLYRRLPYTGGSMSPQSGDTVPELPPVPGKIVVDGDIEWECVDNRVALKGIRIIVRYRDQGSGLPRQVTVDHSFVE